MNLPATLRHRMLATTAGSPLDVLLPNGMPKSFAIKVVREQISPLFEIAFDPERSRAWLQTELENALRAGGYALAARTVKEAEDGNELAHSALLTICRERMGLPLPEGKPGYVQIIAYGQRVFGQSYKRPRGRSRYDNLMRDLLINLAAVLVCREFGVRLTRDFHSAEPSGISIALEALGPRRGLPDEENVRKNILPGLMGELARGYWAELLASRRYTISFFNQVGSVVP